MSTFLCIKAHYEEGRSKKAIARMLDLDVRTVRKHIRRIHGGATAPERAVQSGKLDPDRPQIETWVQQGLSATQIYQRLCKEAPFDSSYQTVRRLVRELRPKEVEVYCRMRYEPGEEAQVDFGEVGRVEVDGVSRKLHLFVMTLCWSRYAYYELVLDQTVPTFLGAIRRAFEYFGGAPARLKPDNLKAAVLLNKLGERYYQKDFFRLCKHYGSVPDAARPGTPTDKGRVERDIRYAKGNHFRGRTLGVYEFEQAAVVDWRERTANVRVHGTTGRRPVDLFAEERSFLRPLPEEAYEIGQLGIYKVRKDCHVQVLGNFYSIPWTLVGKKVLVRLSETKVEAFADDGRVACHLRASGIGHTVTDPAHYPPTKRVSSHEIHRRRVLAVREAGPSAAQYLGALKKGRWVFGEQLRRMHGLLSKHDAPTLDAACRRALFFGVTDGARVVERILDRGLAHRPLPEAKVFDLSAKRGECDYGRPLSEYAALLDHKGVHA